MVVILDKVQNIAILLALALVPVFLFPAPSLPLMQAKMLLLATLILVATLAWAVRAYVAKEVSVPLHFILGSGILVFLAYVLSSIGARGSAISLVGSGIEVDTLAALIVWFALMFLTAAVFSSGERRLPNAFRALFIAGAVLVLFQFLHLVWPGVFSLGGLFSAATANLVGGWHDLSIVLGVLVISALFLSRSMSSTWWRWLTLAVGALAFVFLLLQNMQDVWVALAVFALVALLVDAVRARKAGEKMIGMLRREWLLVALLVVSLASAFFGTMVHDRLPEAMRVVHVEVRPSWQGTFVIGRQSLDQPGQLLFGSGPNTFVKEWNLYKPVNVNETPFWNSDFGSGVGAIPTSFVTVGLAGIFGWGAFLAAVLWSAIRFFRRQLATETEGIERAAAYAALFLTSFLVVYTPGLAIVALTFIFLGLFIATQMPAVRRYSVGLQDTHSMWILAAVAIAALIVVAATLGIARIIVSDVWVNRSVITFNTSGDTARSRTLIEQALTTAPRNDRAHRAAVELGLVEFQQLAASGSADEELQQKLQESLSNTIQHGLSAVSINGTNYQNWLTLAGVYADLAGQNIPGAYENAKAAYVRSLESNPTNPLPLLRLAQLELIEENIPAAQQYLARAVEVKRDFAAAFYLDSQINASEGKYDVALAEAAEVVRLVPEDVTGWFNLGLIAYVAKDYDTARQAFERAVGIQSTYANALYFLGYSYYQLGQMDNALSTFQKVLALNPDNAELKAIVNDLLAGRPIQMQAVE